MKIKALAPWYGSKRTLAPRIIRQFGPHTTYVEPFAGSLAVLLAKEPARHEIVSDLHADLVNLLRVLCDRESAERLHGFVSLVPYCETLYLEACERLRTSTDGDPVERARDYLLTSWQGRNGLCGCENIGNTMARRMTAGGGSGPVRWRSVCDSLPYWHLRLQAVEFHQRCAHETLLNVRDESGTVIYCDPPYVKETRTSVRYTHDFADDDHAKLATALARFRCARVIVSYYRSDITDALYTGWHRIDWPMRKAMSNTGHGAAPADGAPECVYVNGDIYPDG